MAYRKWRKNRRRGPRAPISVGADKAYATRDFVNALRDLWLKHLKPAASATTQI
jgi:hypothetical protein